MMTSDMSSDELAGDAQTLSYLAQAKLQLSSTTAGYIIVEGNASDNSDALTELDALHNYFNANKAQMISDYQKRTAAWARQAAWSKAHPPVQHDTVINFWKINGGLKGANQ